MSIVLEQLTKRYEGYPVVNRLSLEIADGEFFVLIGPSGSGKSTVLRMIAGLNTVDRGRVWLHGRDVTNVPPQQRGVGFVFQHYALFRHMSVAANVEFALAIRHVPKAERRRRRDELLELVGLAGLGRRTPDQLSGGQQQRVALARALAHQPQVLLLDEPFGALDAKIRQELRRALRQIQRELHIATLFVTHDQDEAFELADRLGVMNFGRLLEVGEPSELYQRPQTEFVATFLGTSHLMAGQAVAGAVQVGPLRFPLKTEPAQVDPQPVQVLFRPEDIALAATREALDGTVLGQGQVEQCTFSGAFQRVRLRLPGLSGVLSIAPPVPFGENDIRLEAMRGLEQARRTPLEPGSEVWVGVRRIHALARSGMSCLLLTDGSTQAEAAITLGGQIARLAHARVTLLAYGRPPEELEAHLQWARDTLGSGLASLEVRTTPDPLPVAVTLEVERQAFDLAVLGLATPGGLGLAEKVLEAGRHHLLLVSQLRPIPASALLCVTGSEPGKDDMLAAGPLLNHLGAETTLLSVLPHAEVEAPRRRSMDGFLARGARTLATMGVPTETALEFGPVPAAAVG
jgi:sulfate transport system ATP-binding protein